jgi:hypothetical protein
VPWTGPHGTLVVRFRERDTSTRRESGTPPRVAQEYLEWALPDKRSLSLLHRSAACNNAPRLHRPTGSCTQRHPLQRSAVRCYEHPGAVTAAAATKPTLSAAAAASAPFKLAAATGRKPAGPQPDPSERCEGGRGVSSGASAAL